MDHSRVQGQHNPTISPSAVNIALKESAHDQNDPGNEELRDVYGRPWIMPGPIISGMTPSALADSSNAKPSAWGMTLTTLTAGMLIPPDVLARMPPEQRAKLEQSMQAGSGKTTIHVSAACRPLSFHR